MSIFRVSSSESFNEKKFPLLITLVFFVITIYVAFGVHNYWTFDQDGIQYLNGGKEILKGNGKNVGLPNAPAIGTIIYAGLANVFGDGFSVMKSISVLSGTGIVFFSYYITRNIFDSKTALITHKLEKIGEKYIKNLKTLSPHSKKISDKLPINFKWIGLIKLILPNSKIIHCNRNSKDVCLSIFKNYFVSDKLKYAYNLKELTEFYKLYSNLMIHWKKTLPKLLLPTQRYDL